LKNYCIILIFIIITANIISAEEYHFASIEQLIEQEIGSKVLPEIYKKLGIDITITPLPGKRAEKEATSGLKDGEIMRIWTYGEENSTMKRVPTPYYYLETMAFINKNSGIEINSVEELKKYSLAKVRGVKHTNNITEGMTNVRDLDTTEQMMRFLQKGRADVALTNTIDGLFILAELGFTDIIPVDNPLAVLDLFHYIHEDHTDLVSRVDEVIKQMKSTGELEEIIIKKEQEVINNQEIERL